MKAVERIAKRLGVPQTQVKDVLNAYYDELEAMPADETVRSPLGVFAWREQKKRPIVMATGRKTHVKAKRKLVFRPSPRFIKKLGGESDA